MAEWKKVIVSGSEAHLTGITGSNLTDNRIVFTSNSGALSTDDTLQYSNGTLSGSIFSGSFVGDGSQLTGVTAEWDGTHSGSASITGSFTVSGSTGTIVDFTGVDAISGSVFSGSFVGDGSGLTGLVTNLNYSASVGSGSLDLKDEDFIITGSAYGIVTSGSGNTLTISLDDNINVSGSLTASGGITVPGDIINELTASYAMNAETSAINSGTQIEVTPATGSWILRHGLNTKYPLVEIWDSATDKVVEPNEIESIDYQTIKVTFTTPIAGYANISRAGHVVSGSTLWENIIAGPSGSQVDVVTGATYNPGVLGVTGSLEVTDGVSGSFSGSFQGDGSQLTGIATSLAISASNNTSGSLDLKNDALIISGTLGEVDVDYNNTTKTLQIGLPDDVNIAGDLVVTGDITAKEFNTQLISSSIIYDSGSTKFGDTFDDLHEFTGSISSTGSVVDFTGTPAISGSIFSGSFVGDGSGLTGIATTLAYSGSIGSGSIDLKQDAFVITGSSYGIVTSGSGNTLTVSLDDNIHVSGTLTASGGITVPGDIINQLTASYAMNAETSALNSGTSIQVTPATGSWILNHNLSTKTPLVEIWSDDKIIQPNEVEALDFQTVKVTFTAPVAGYANISRAGHVISGSTLWENIIVGPSGSQVDLTVGGTYNPGVLGITGSLEVTDGISGSFSGSFQGDGSQLTGVTAEWDGTHSGSAEITGSLTVSGSTGTIVDFTGVDAISGSIFSGSFVGDGSGLTGLVTNLNISASIGSGSLDLKTDSLIVSGTANEIEVNFDDATNTLQVGLPDDVIIAGDLTVNGTTTTINTENLLIEDRWALLASGSTSGVDGGIIVQSSINGGAPSGSAFGIDTSADRWALQKDFGDTENTITPDAYITTTEFDISSSLPTNPTYGGAANGYGNIFVATDTEEIFIWA